MNLLNEKEKRIFWIVILATAVVSLITGVIGGWISWVMDLIQNHGDFVYDSTKLNFAMETLLLAMGTISVFLFFFNKSRRNLANFIMFGCEMGLTFVITAYWYGKGSIGMGGSFLAFGLVIAIASMFIALASLFCAKHKTKAEEESQEESEKQE